MRTTCIRLMAFLGMQPQFHNNDISNKLKKNKTRPTEMEVSPYTDLITSEGFCEGGGDSNTDEFSEKFQRGGGFRSVFFKVCLVLIFLNTIVEKTYPEMILLFINFMLKNTIGDGGSTAL